MTNTKYKIQNTNTNTQKQVQIHWLQHNEHFLETACKPALEQCFTECDKYKYKTQIQNKNTNTLAST